MFLLHTTHVVLYGPSKELYLSTCVVLIMQEQKDLFYPDLKFLKPIPPLKLSEQFSSISTLTITQKGKAINCQLVETSASITFQLLKEL